MNNILRFAFCFLFLVGLLVAASCQQASTTSDHPVFPTEPATAEPLLESAVLDGSETLTLFDGKSLDGWIPTNFGGEGECRVEDGLLILETGYPMTGVTSTRTDLPKTDFEISLEVRRTSGVDFFCGLTFPVAESHCSLIVGGWAGPVVGLSCLDGQDASRNETRKLMTFEKNRWYKIKVRVQPNRIAAWIDEAQVVDQDITGREISVRNETLPSRPLGICCFETNSEFKNIQLVKLKATE